MSKRSRKPAPVIEALPDTLARNELADANVASQLLSAATTEVLASAELYMLVGRIEAAHFMETVSARVIAETYAKARDHLGKMGSVTVRGPDGVPKHVSDMETFCEAVMPVSARRCRQILANVEALGAELFEQAERIGFRARDYQALRALPAAEQEAVKQALKSGSQEEVLGLVAELAARNEALRQQAEADRKQIKAKQAVIDRKQARIDVLEEAIGHRDSAEPSEREAAQINDLRAVGLEAEMAVRRMGACVGAVMDAPATETTEVAARHTIEFIAQVLAELIEHLGIRVDFNERVSPSWLDGVEIPSAEAKKR